MTVWDAGCWIAMIIGTVGPFTVVVWYARAVKKRIRDLNDN